MAEKISENLRQTCGSNIGGGGGGGQIWEVGVGQIMIDRIRFVFLVFTGE